MNNAGSKIADLSQFSEVLLTKHYQRDLKNFIQRMKGVIQSGVFVFCEIVHCSLPNILHKEVHFKQALQQRRFEIYRLIPTTELNVVFPYVSTGVIQVDIKKSSCLLKVCDSTKLTKIRIVDAMLCPFYNKRK